MTPAPRGVAPDDTEEIPIPTPTTGLSGPSGPGGAAAVDPADDEWLRPDPIRWTVVNRLAVIGRRHARHLRDLTGSPRRPAPHAVVFLYRDLATTGVKIATRMFTHAELTDLLDSPDTPGRPGRPGGASTPGTLDVAAGGGLPTVLRTLHARGAEFARAGRFDPLRHMSTRTEPGIGPHDTDYLGVATSTLHPGEDGLLAWRGVARLVDRTRLLARIPDADDILATTVTVDSTHTLSDPRGGNLFTTRTWRWADPDPDRCDTDLAEVRATLDQLHMLIINPAAAAAAVPHPRRAAP